MRAGASGFIHYCKTARDRAEHSPSAKVGRLLHLLYNCGELALGTAAREVHEAIARDDDPEGASEAALLVGLGSGSGSG